MHFVILCLDSRFSLAQLPQRLVEILLSNSLEVNGEGFLSAQYIDIVQWSAQIYFCLTEMWSSPVYIEIKDAGIG